MIAIIGAGMAGLACARRLADAGRDVVVYDKGRGLGGRIATRRTDFGSFDHGAQYATADGREFSAYLKDTVSMGQGARWAEIIGAKARIVGTPGMTALVKPLAEGLDIHRATEVSGFSKAGGGWQLHLTSGDRAGPFEQAVLTAPAPQAIRLLGDFAAHFPALAEIKYAPCWKLMAAFGEPL